MKAVVISGSGLLSGDRGWYGDGYEDGPAGLDSELGWRPFDLGFLILTVQWTGIQ